jgi:transposase
MSERKSYRLSHDELADIEYTLANSPLPEVVRRATAIWLLHLGRSPRTAAQVLAVSDGTIRTWHRRWRHMGLIGLVHPVEENHPGKKAANFILELEEALRTDPRTLGYKDVVWTADELREYLTQKTGTVLSRNHFYVLLSGQGYTWRQLKHDLTVLHKYRDKR